MLKKQFIQQAGTDVADLLRWLARNFIAIIAIERPVKYYLMLVSLVAYVMILNINILKRQAVLVFRV